MTESSNQRVDLKAFAKRIDLVSRDAKNPLAGTFELTARCNLRCKMCYVRLEASELEKYGRELTAKEWISIGRAASESGTLFLQITGGEPLLRNDFFDIYDALCDFGFVITLNTNATLITPDIAKRLRARRPSLVSVTLYGGNADTYERLCMNRSGYDRAISGIQNLIDSGMPPKILSTIVRDNVDDVTEVMRFAKEHNLPFTPSTIIFKEREEAAGDADAVRLRLEEEDYLDSRLDEAYQLLYPEEWANSREVLRELRKTPSDEPAVLPVYQPRPGFPCSAGNSKYWITWNGEMKPCAMAPFPISYPLRDGFPAAWKDMYNACALISVPTECRTCKVRRHCILCLAGLASESGEYGKINEYACNEALRRAKMFSPQTSV